MKFKVVRASDGCVMMQATDKTCVYDDATVRSLNNAGYKVYMDGRIYRPQKEEKKE